MTEPYIRASELKDFVFCRRAWFLERQGAETTLTDARQLGAADHQQRARVVRLGQRLYTTGHRLWIAALLALGVLLLVWGLYR